MALDNLPDQTTREAPSDLMRETFIAPTLLPTCCVCNLVLDKTRSIPGRTRWCTLRTYQKRHGVLSSAVLRTHTYCPKCFTQVMATARQHLKTIGVPS